MNHSTLFKFTWIMRCFLLSVFALFESINAFGATNEEITSVWKEFRTHHPYGYQTVGLKHLGDECVIIISEPAESVTEITLNNIFTKYKGTTQTQRFAFGYDGWLADFVGCIKFESDEAFYQFTKELFTTLYGTDYKASYTDLDNQRSHTYFSHKNLNYSISAAEIEKWMLIDGETFINSKGDKRNVSQLLSSNLSNSNDLWYSSERGFVVWCFDSKKHLADESFKQNARRFALDTDLIIGAIGRKGRNFVIIARERNVSTEVLPPLRLETIKLLATTKNDNLAQSYERHHVFAGKTHTQQDVAPIYLSDELWHTEYGNLLNLTDQMLKSWSENGRIEYSKFYHPKPIDWAFNNGAVRDLETDQLTYNWNTAGAGYVIQGDNDFDIYAVNRTGSLPVSYIPGGMEGKVDETVNDAEELAYDFFSELSSPELVRVVQYSSLYQIFRYYSNSSDESIMSSNLITDDFLKAHNISPQLADAVRARSLALENLSKSNYAAPNYSSLEPYIESLLKIAASRDGSENVIERAIERYYKKTVENNPYVRLNEISSSENGNEIIAFLKEKLGDQYIDSLRRNPMSRENAEKEFYEYLNPNLQQVSAYIKNYTQKVGTFPYSKAAHYIINPRQLELDVKEIYNRETSGVREYSARVKAYNEKVDKYNESVKAGNATLFDSYSLNAERLSIELLEKTIKKQQEAKEQEVMNLLYLSVDDQLSKSLAALNWLLTDPGEYTEPLGGFFSGLFTSNHNTWIKSPSLASSFNGTGYGGHNLDAHVTPIRFANNLRAGKCRISMVDGQRVVAVSKADRSRVTPAVLRQIERRISTNQEISLPDAPIERTKNVLFEEMNATCQERGFSSQFEIAEVSPSKTVQIKELDCGTLDELYSSISDAVANNEPLPVKEIRYKGMSAREVQVQVDNLRECILERTIDNEAVLADFDVNEIEATVKENGMVVITLPQKVSSIPRNTYKAGMMEFQIPANAEEVFKSVIKKVSDMPKEKINNHFKMMRQIKLELQKHPEIRYEDVKDEYIRLYGFILLENSDESFKNMAA